MKRFTFSNITRSTALFALASLCPAWAQTPECPTSEPVQATDAQSGKYQRRVLQLRNGSFVRTACVLQGEEWVLGKKSSSRRIPARFVHSVTNEKELLKELSDQIKASTPGTLPAWCLQRGLLKEGFAQLDKNLGSHGLRKQSLITLEQFAHFLPAPPTTEEETPPSAMFAEHAKWLASKNTASLHELAAQSLAGTATAQARSRTADEPDPWTQCLTQVLKGNKARQRDLALSTLTQWKGTHSGETLRRFAMLDSSESTRNHSARLLGTLDDPKQIFGLTGWLDHKNQEVRARAASALGWSGYPAAVPALVAALGSGSSSIGRVPHSNIFLGSQTAYVQDYDVEIANNSSIADPIINVQPAGVALDVGVVSVAIHRTVYQRALSRITGHKPGTTEKAWSKWLTEYPTVDTSWRAPWPSPPTSN